MTGAMPGRTDVRPSADVDRRLAIAFGGLTLSLLMVVLLGAGWYFHGVMERVENKLSTQLTEVLANAVSRISFSGKYHARLLLEEIKAARPGIVYLRLVSPEGEVLAHSDPAQNDTLIDEPSRHMVGQLLGGSEAQRVRQFQLHGEPIREISLPYRGGYDNSVVGVIQVGLAEQERQQALRQGLAFLVLLVVAVSAVGTLATLRLSAYFGAPMRQLANELSATFEALPDLLIEMDQDGRYVQVLTQHEELLAAPAEELLGKIVTEVLPKEAAESVLRALQQARATGVSRGAQIKLPLSDGDHWFELSVARKSVAGEGAQRFIVLSRDVTERVQASARMEHQARHDPLTGLPNRLMLQMRAAHALELARREGQKVALLMIDLDHFKDINDSFGHATGDALLQVVAQRIGARARHADTVCRLGGDEFTVLVENVAHVGDLGALALSLINLLEEPIRLPNGSEVVVGASIGIAVFPDNGDSELALMQGADAAMYLAKSEGRGSYRFFTEALTVAARERIDLEARLRRALAKGELQLHFQPQVDIASGAVVGAEALVRWLSPDEGLIAPGRFIPVAEQSDLILSIGRWVLLETCRQGRLWQLAGLPALTLAVNVAARQVTQGDLAGVVASVLRETGFPAQQLELELTETALIDNQERVLDVLGRLRALGVRIAVDDFGTGYSSLAYLKRFPLDVLKIDKSFVDDIPRLLDDMEITAAIIGMAHSLRLKVMAEGVETVAQLDFLRAHGCDSYQGFLKSRPMPAGEFASFIRETLAA